MQAAFRVKNRGNNLPADPAPVKGQAAEGTTVSAETVATMHTPMSGYPGHVCRRPARADAQLREWPLSQR